MSRDKGISIGGSSGSNHWLVGYSITGVCNWLSFHWNLWLVIRAYSSSKSISFHYKRWKQKLKNQVHTTRTNSWRWILTIVKLMRKGGLFFFVRIYHTALEVIWDATYRTTIEIGSLLKSEWANIARKAKGHSSRITFLKWSNNFWYVDMEGRIYGIIR